MGVLGQRRRRRGLLAGLGVAAALAAVVAGGFAGAARAAEPPKVAPTTSVDLGTLSAAAAFSPLPAGPAEKLRPDGQENEQDVKAAAQSPRGHKNKGPAAPASQVVTSNTGFSGFAGINHFDQGAAGTGAFAGSQFSLEPPDQGLCVGNGFVFENVNTAVRVDDTSGAALTLPVPINQFLGLLPEEDSNLVFGDFTSDPKCYFDVSTQRWFFTILQLGVDPVSGDLDGTSKQFLAVSQTDDPTGAWTVYSFDTTNDFGANCPCFGDQPLIGADQYGIYIAANSFPLFSDGFNGAVIYALSKSQLVAGSDATIVQLDVPTLAEGQAYSVQPATTPTGVYDTSFGGTEYFVSALDFAGTSDTRVGLWALSNTSSLDAVPNLSFYNTLVGTERYQAPPLAQQQSGDAPLHDCLNDVSCATAVLGGPDPKAPNPINPLNTNDDRMNQVVFANGTLWSGLNTGVKQADGSVRSGIAWFAIAPKVKKPGKLKFALVGQGYVSVNGADVYFPSIGVNAAGDAVMGFTLSGTTYYPSAAYAILKSHTQPVKNPPDVHVAQPGAGPADGFTGYASLDDADQGVERWGDYSAAVAAPDGSVWFATEYIGQTCNLATWAIDPTCGGTRTFYANWGTFIGHVTP